MTLPLPPNPQPGHDGWPMAGFLGPLLSTLPTLLAQAGTVPSVVWISVAGIVASFVTPITVARVQGKTNLRILELESRLAALTVKDVSLAADNARLTAVNARLAAENSKYFEHLIDRVAADMG